MALVPVDYDPFSGGGVPVDYDPFAGNAPKESPGFLKSIVGGLYDTKQTLEGAGALVGGAIEKYTPFEDLGRQTKDYWLNQYKATGEQAKPYEGTMSFSDADNLSDYWTWAKEQGGRLVPTMAAAATGAGAGALLSRGAAEVGGGAMIRTLAEKAVEKNVQKAMATKVGQELGEKMVRDQVAKATIAEIGAKAGMFGTVAAMESGGNYTELAEKGVNAPFSSMASGTAAASLELLGGNIKLIERFFGPAASKVIGKAFANGDGVALKGASKALVDVAENMSAEALQEGGQELLSIFNVVANTDEKLLTGENWTRIKESMAGGALGGFGGGMVEVATKPKGDDAKATPSIDKEAALGKIRAAASTLSDDDVSALKGKAGQYGIMDAIISSAREPGEIASFARASSAYLKEKNAPKQPGKSSADDLFESLANENTNFEMDRLVGEYQNSEENHAKRLMGEWANVAVDLANREPLRQGRKLLPEPVRDFSLVGTPYTPKEDQTPESLRPAIVKMEEQLKNGTTSGLITNGLHGNEQEVTGRFVGTNPEWFHKKTVEAYDKANGTDYAKVVNKLTVLTAIARMRKGVELNKAQAKAWEYLTVQARELQQKDPELRLHQSAANMEQDGFELVGKEIPAGELRPGDKVVLRGGDEYHHAGHDHRGNAVLEGKDTKRLDPFDMLPVDGVKRGNGVIRREDLQVEPAHVPTGLDNPDLALEHFENAIPKEDRAAMADVFAYIRKNGLHRQTSFAQQLFNMVGVMYEGRTGKKLAILGGNADIIKKEAHYELNTERRTQEGTSSPRRDGTEGPGAGTRQGVSGDDRQAGSGPAGATAAKSTAVSDPVPPREPVSATAPASSPQFTIEPLGSGIIVKGDIAQVRAKLEQAGVKQKGLPNAKQGGLVFPKKYEAAIRAALEAQNNPARETQEGGNRTVDVAGMNAMVMPRGPSTMIQVFVPREDGSVLVKNGEPLTAAALTESAAIEKLRAKIERSVTSKKETTHAQTDTVDTATPVSKANPENAPAVEGGSESAAAGVSDAVAGGVKEPWQMTRGEWENDIRKIDSSSSALEKALGYKILPGDSNGSALRAKAKKMHDEAKRSLSGIEPGQPIRSSADRNKRDAAWEKSNKARELFKKADDADAVAKGKLDATHKNIIKKAISEGKPVPAGVLADYPDLTPQGAIKAQPSQSDESAPVKQASNKETTPKQADAASDVIKDGLQSNKPAAEMTAAELLRAAADKMDATDKAEVPAATDKTENVPTETDNQGATEEQAQENGKTQAGREDATAKTKETDKGVALYSKRESFASQLDKYATGGIKGTSPLSVSETPDVLRLLGADALPVVIKQDTVKKILHDKHGLPLDLLKKLPEHLASPIMVFDSATEPGGLVVMTEMQHEGKTIVATVHLNSYAGRYEVNRVSSVYGKDNNGIFGKWIDRGLLRYQDKEKSRLWSVTRGLQLPKVRGTNSDFSKKNILTDDDLVKYSKGESATGTTTAQVENELRTFLKRGYDKLTGSGKLKIVQSVEELPGGENLLNSVAGSNIPKNIISELNAIHPGVEGFVSSHHRMITLHELRIPKELRGEGLGTKFMEILTRYADESGMTISLTAAGDYGGSRSGQERFYARHGFVKNKGRNKDYRISENMIRRPQAAHPLYSKDGSIAGVFDPKTGRITLVSDNIKPGDAEYVMLHEGLHALMREDVIFIKNHDAILDQFEAKRRYDYRVQDAFRRVPEDTPAHLVNEEALAYFIENKANHETSLFKKILANIRMWLMRMGIPMKNLTTDDLVAMVTQGMKSMANRATVKESLSVGDMGPALYSKRSVVDDIFDTPEESTFTADLDIAEEGRATKLWDYLVFKAQDKFNSLKKVQEKAKKSRGLQNLPESEDAYLAELRYHGRAGARIEDFHEEHVEPMIEAIHKAGLTLEDVGRYLWARHAPEANAQLAKINPDMENNTALSGMSNEEAQRVLDGFGAKLEALEDIGKRVDVITKMRRDLLIESGLEKTETVAAWEKSYKHYVPLHREGKGGNLPSQGRGFDTRGKEKRRTGSEKDVVNILAHVVAQYEKTAIKAEKATVGRTLLEFVKNNPNPDMWEVDKVTFKPTFDKDGLVQYREDKGFVLADNVLVVKVNGEDNRITFSQDNDHAKRIVSSMKNLGAEQSGILVRSLATVNRVLAVINTSANPEFVVSNLFRDLQTAGFNLNATEAKDLKAAIFKDVAKSWRGIRAAQKKDYRHPWARYYREFRQAGGKTGWLEFYKDIEHREAKLQKMLDEMGDGSMMKIKRGLNAIEQFVEHENTAVENAIRLATFVNARKAGISEARAAALAKELTVNFNRKGDAGQMLNALYLFYNASVQGTVRMFQAARNPKVMALMGGTVVAAAMLDMMNRAIGGDDDDGEPFYDKLPSHVTERNLVIMRPGGDYFKIPLPWGYNVLHVMGQEVGKGLDDSYHGYNAGKSAMRVLGTAVSSFNPIGSEAGILQMISPTITDPIVQWAENKDWAGRKLRPDSSFDQDKPESQKYWNSVREPSRWVAEKLNELTGGDKVRPGMVDISPELFDLWIDTFTGGAGRFLADMVATPIKAIKGEEIEAHTIPLARKLYGSQSPASTGTAFYDHLESIGVVKRQLEFYKGDLEKLAEIRAEHGDELGMIRVAAAHEKAVGKLRKQRRVVEASRSLSEEEKKARLKQIDENTRSLMQRFNRMYRERVLDKAA